MEKLSDEDICSWLRFGNETNHDRALNQIYNEHYTVILAHVKKNSGDDDDALDIFQDAVVVFYENLRKGKFELKSSIRTYLFSVARNLWLNKLKAKKRTVGMADEFDAVSLDDNSLDVLEANEKTKLLMKIIDEVNGDCKKLLLMYYYDRLRMDEIALRLNLANANVAKSKKLSCMRKLKNLVSKYPNLKSLLRKS